MYPQPHPHIALTSSFQVSLHLLSWGKGASEVQKYGLPLQPGGEDL